MPWYRHHPICLKIYSVAVPNKKTFEFVLSIEVCVAFGNNPLAFPTTCTYSKHCINNTCKYALAQLKITYGELFTICLAQVDYLSTAQTVEDPPSPHYFQLLPAL